MRFIAVNREFFGPDVSALGSPGGACDVGKVTCDHPAVAAYLRATLRIHE
jgi:hypothetical protein